MTVLTSLGGKFLISYLEMNQKLKNINIFILLKYYILKKIAFFFSFHVAVMSHYKLIYLNILFTAFQGKGLR